MAARSYGSTDSQQHPYHRLTDIPGNVGEAEFSQVSARVREQGNVVKTNLQRLEQLAKDFGTARDGLQLRDDVQQLMRELYGQIQQFNKECMILENIVNRTDVNQKRAADNFRRNVNESISKFQRLSKEVERLERDNPLQQSNPFGETDNYTQSSGTSAGQSTYQQGQILALEQDRRLVEQRNEAMTQLFHDIQDLNSIARDIAVEVDTQQDTIDLIEDNVEAAADNVGHGVTNLRKAAWYQVIEQVLSVYRPNAVVLQCGADSLSGDRLGCFNLSLRGHAECVSFMRKQNLPLLILGGGGYTIRNVARCWTYETAMALDCDITNDLPYNDYFEYFGPDFKLHISPSNMANQNSPEYLNQIKAKVLENLRMTPHAPGVQMRPIPEDGIKVEEERNEDKDNPNERITQHMQDKTIQREDEFSDSEDEDDRRDEVTHKEDSAPSRKRARTASPNPSADAAQPPQGGASPPRPEPSPITPGVALEGVASQAQGAVPPEVVPPPKPSPLTTTTVASTTNATPTSPEATAKKTDEATEGQSQPPSEEQPMEH